MKKRNNQKKYSLVIEDKVDTTFHDSQLKNYRNEAEKWCKENNVTSSYCYYKSGFLSTTEKNQIEKVFSKGTWNAFSVNDILPILNEYTDNQIIDDYVNKHTSKKINLSDINDCEEDLYKKLIKAFNDNNFNIIDWRKEGNFVGVYAKKGNRHYWAGCRKKAKKQNQNFYICCTANKKEFELLKEKKIETEQIIFSPDDDNNAFPCDFYMTETYFSKFNSSNTEEQQVMLTEFIRLCEKIMSSIVD